MRTIRGKIGKIMILVISLVFLYPLVYTLLASLKDNAEIFSNPFGLPKVIALSNYSKAWTQANMGIYFKNSLLVTVVTMFSHLVFGSMAAFAC